MKSWIKYMHWLSLPAIFCIFSVSLAEEIQMLRFHENNSLEEIKSIIAAEGKPGMLYFRGKYCHWCDKLEEEVFSNDSARTYIEENFACFKCGPEISKTYPIFGVPHTIIIDREGEVLERIAGYYPLNAFLEKLDRVIKGDVNVSVRNEAKTYKEAKDAYEAEPDNPKAAWDYAQKLMGVGDVKNAIPVYERLVNLTLEDKSQERNKYLNLADCYDMVDRRLIPNEENRARAIKYYEAALGMNLLETTNQKVKVYAKLGKLYFQAHDYGTAIKYLKMIPYDLEEVTDNRTKSEAGMVRMYLPFAYARAGEVGTGKAELERFFRWTYDRKEYWQLSRYCLDCEMFGHFTAEALSWIEKAYKGHFDDLESLQKRKASLKDEEESKKNKEEEERLLSGCYQVVYGHEKLLVRNDEFEKAVGVLERGLQLPEGLNSGFYKMNSPPASPPRI